MLLPILSKELIELAGRRQTYLTRVIYALALFGLFWFLFRSMGMRDGSMLDLGKGSELLRNLFLLQVASIYLLVPPIISTSITEEKEKGTIITLVSLPMRSSAILLQKLFGRLLPVLTMLALCFPLYAIAYTLGGVDAASVGIAALCLIIESIKVGALAMLVSCAQKTNTLAVAFTYMWLLLFAPLCTSPLLTVLIRADFNVGFLLMQLVISIPFIIIFIALGARLLRKHALHIPDAYQFAWQVPREGEHVNPLVHRDNPWTLPRKDLPGMEPLRWVETPRDWMTSKQALLLATMTLVVMLLPAIQLGSTANFGAPVMVVCWLVILVRTPIKVIHSHSRPVDGEVNQVLLTTPMTGWDMVLQINAARHEGFIKVFWFMLAGSVVNAIVGAGPPLVGMLFALVALAASLSMFVIYYQLQIWFGTLLALRIRSRTRSLITLLMLNLMAFAILPMLLHDAQAAGPTLVRFYVWLDPVVFLLLCDGLVHGEQGASALPVLMIVLLFWGGLVAVLRSYVLHRADRLMGRPV